MTAIAGIIHFDGRPVDRSTIERMQHVLTPYGTEAQHHIHQGSSAFLRTLLRTTPEDLFDKQPLVHAQTGITLLFDGRIDNREELATALELAAADLACMSDSDVVLRACLRWGGSAPERLLGDFAIACWTPREKKLWLARDPLAVRPLYWYRQNKFFAFSTMPKTLFAIPGVPRAICEERLHDYLCLMPMKGPESFFKDVFRVEPGHMLLFDGERTVSTQFHAFDPKSELILGSDGEYVEAFRETLERAVEVRLRALGPVASHLSSGRDSSTVTALAAQQLARRNERLMAYTAVPREGFDGPVPHGHHADESIGATSVAALYPNIEHILIRPPRESSPLDQLRDHVERLDRAPMNICNMMWSAEIERDVASRGGRVLLTGSRGNMTISHSGETYLPWLLKHGHWLTWLRENIALRKRRPHLSYRRLATHSFSPFLPSGLWQRLQKKSGRDWAFSSFSAVHPNFLEQMNSGSRAKDMGWDPSYQPTSDNRRATIEYINFQDHGDYSAGANAYGIEIRDPTVDRKLVELCLAMPESQFFRAGQTCWLLYRAMKDRLPEEILCPKSKGYQLADWFERLDASLPKIRKELESMATHQRIEDIIDLVGLERELDDWPEAKRGTSQAERRYRIKLLRGLSVGAFIRYVEPDNFS